MRLLQCSYDDLLAEALPISSEAVQEVFRQSSIMQMTVVAREGICHMCMNMPHSSPSPEVTPLPFLKHKACGSHVTGCVVLMLSRALTADSPDDDHLPVFSKGELHEGQLSDPVLSRVLHYVEHGQHPSRREKPVPVMVIIILYTFGETDHIRCQPYRASTDQVTKRRRH